MKSFLLLLFVFTFQFTYAQINQDSILQIIESTSDDKTKFKNYIKLIRLNKFKDLEKVKLYCDNLYNLSKSFETERTKAFGDLYMGFYHRIKGDVSVSRSFLEKAIDYGQKNDDYELEGSGLNEFAILVESQGNSSEAIQLYQEICDLYLENNDEESTISPTSNIGLLYQNLGDFENAIKYYGMAHQLAKKHEDHYNVELTAGNISAVYINQNKIDSALYYANICLEISEKYGYTRSIAFANVLLAHIFLGRADYENALKYALGAHEVYKTYPEKSLLLNSFTLLSDIYAKLNDNEKAMASNKEALRIAEEINYIAGINLSHKAITAAYEVQGDYKNALKHYKLFKTYSDSLTNTEKSSIVEELNIKYETARKDVEIANQKLEITEKTSQRNFYLAGLIIIGLLSTFFLNRYQLKQRLSEQKIVGLQQKQKIMAIDYIVQGQEEERRRVAKDLHDGLGGLLSTAKMQLQKIHGEIEKLSELELFSKAEKLIDNAHDEVRRISHDMMPDVLMNMGLPAAIEEIADNIEAGGGPNVKYYFSDPDMRFGETQEVILYRVIQEILNNAIKHSESDTIIIQLTSNYAETQLTIEDNGIGFDPKNSHIKNGIGLKNIKSRVNYLNGTFSLESDPGQGTTYHIVIPSARS